MNIFILDNDITKCAEYHVDKHVVKMCLESAQLLCTLRGLTTREIRDFPYLPNHFNHPCSIWVRKSLDNYEWLYCLALSLNDEYGYRYGGKTHKSIEVVLKLPDIDLPSKGLTPFAQAMPDEYKNEDAVIAYRNYYNQDKKHLLSWKYRRTPEWINQL